MRRSGQDNIGKAEIQPLCLRITPITNQNIGEGKDATVRTESIRTRSGSGSACSTRSARVSIGAFADGNWPIDMWSRETLFNGRFEQGSLWNRGDDIRIGFAALTRIVQVCIFARSIMPMNAMRSPINTLSLPFARAVTDGSRTC